jgi:hypothetical protein
MPHRKLQKHYDEEQRLQTPRLREKDWQRGEVHLPERQRHTVQNGYSSTGKLIFQQLYWTWSGS